MKLLEIEEGHMLECPTVGNANVYLTCSPYQHIKKIMPLLPLLLIQDKAMHY